MYDQELAVALEATQVAARLCQRIQARVQTEAIDKKDKSPVTIADFGSQAIIAKALAKAFPTISLIAEEDSTALQTNENNSHLKNIVEEVRHALNTPDISSDLVCQWIDHGTTKTYSDRFWTLDPLDGTKGFLRGQQYAIALALIEDGQPVCATLACPNLENPDGSIGAIYTAKGSEVQLIPIDSVPQYLISASREKDLTQMRTCESVESEHSDHYRSKTIRKTLGIEKAPVRMDSQAKYAIVARGDAEIYLRLPTRPGYVERIWDHAAGYAILKAAGGSITDIDGKPLDFRQGQGLDNNRGIVASNGPAHHRLIEAIAAADLPPGI